MLQGKRPLDWLMNGIKLAAMWTFAGAITVAALLAIARGQAANRFDICMFILGWGFLYFALKKKTPKWLWGLLQIGAGVCNNWYEFGRMAREGTGDQFYGRLILVFAGIAVMGTGIETWLDAVSPDDPPKELIATPQSTESSAVPNPAKQAPEAKS